MTIIPFQSGADAIRLPPREFLQRLPVRVSHLVFETELEGKNKQSEKELEKIPWIKLKNKLSALSEPSNLLDQRNEPIYLFKMEHGQEFQCFKTNYYFEEFEPPLSAVWVVRFEQHTHFATFSFHRYFESSCTSITDGNAWDFLKTLDYNDHDINTLLESTVPGGNIDLAVAPKSFNRDELAKMLKLDIESHYVTKSKIFDDMAEVLMSFQVEHDQTEKPRPIIIYELKGMSERAAGEVIQILLEIEAYRAMASRQISRETLPEKLNFLRKKEEHFALVSEVCQEIICKKPNWINLIIDLVKADDYLPILTELTKIMLQIDHETAEHARQYDTAQAYCDLVLDRLDDLREMPIDQEPTIKTFLRHRLKQASQTHKAMGQRQNCLAQQVSQLDGLLRSRMEARQSFSVHCVHFMILGLTILFTFKYLPEIIEKLELQQQWAHWLLSWQTMTISFGILSIAVVLLFAKKIVTRKYFIAKLDKAAKHIG